MVLVDTPGFVGKFDPGIDGIIREISRCLFDIDDVLRKLCLLYVTTVNHHHQELLFRYQSHWMALLDNDFSGLVVATTDRDDMDMEWISTREMDWRDSCTPLQRRGATISRLGPTLDSAASIMSYLDRRFPTRFGQTKSEGSSISRAQALAHESLRPDQIRLVDLLHGENDENVCVNLLVVGFDDNAKYESLSYSVGNQAKTAKLKLGHHDRQEIIEVTPRLESILRHLRYPDKNRRLWIDAISINQDDLEERAREVRRLDKIFAQAQIVCIWLGDGEDDSDLAMEFIPQVLDFGAFDKLVRDETKERHWLALAKLMAREWFTRRWVVQEMALAHRATVYCGSRKISWPDMAAAAALFGTHWGEIVHRLPPLQAFMFGDVQTPGATSLVELSAKVLHRDQKGKSLQRRLGLETLLAMLPMFDVTVPSDAVYAVINLAHDAYNTTEIPIDYNLAPSSLFAKVIDFIIKNAGSMDIICRPWAPICSRLPSFVSTVSSYAFERRQDGQYYRQNADSLTGFPGRSIYRAAGSSRPRHSMSLSPSLPILQSEGRLLGVIDTTGGRSLNGNVPREWTEIAGWQDRSKPVPEMFWRTLVADRGPGGTDPPIFYGNACRFAFSRGRRDIDVSELLKTSNSANERQFLQRVQATIWNRNFFVIQDTEDTYCFCLGPAEARLYDLVIVVSGCSVPVVFRAQTDHVGQKSYLFTMIGECFVHGYMDGEALRPEAHTVPLNYWIS